MCTVISIVLCAAGYVYFALAENYDPCDYASLGDLCVTVFGMDYELEVVGNSIESAEIHSLSSSFSVFSLYLEQVKT